MDSFCDQRRYELEELITNIQIILIFKFYSWILFLVIFILFWNKNGTRFSIISHKQLYNDWLQTKEFFTVEGSQACIRSATFFIILETIKEKDSTI